MAAKNDITGDSIQSRILSMEGRDNWDRIFGKKEKNTKKEKKYKWVEPGENNEPVETVWTETQIIDQCFEWWSEQMTKYDKAHLINHDRCIADFCAVHFATEVK